MMHVRIPDFSQPLARRVEAVAPADPIHAAIARHRVAWDAFQIAPEGEASERAETDMGDALDALLATGCETRTGAMVLLNHLRWWLIEEREFADSYGPSYDVALARAGDLALLLNAAWTRPPASVPEDEHPVRLGTVANGIVQRLATDLTLTGKIAGELIAAVAIIAGGMWLTGFASLI